MKKRKVKPTQKLRWAATFIEHCGDHWRPTNAIEEINKNALMGIPYLLRKIANEL